MFEKWESKSYPGVDAVELHRHAFQWWGNAGFRVVETAPGQFRATSASRWGLEREATITVKDIKGTAVLELRMKANVTTDGIVAGGLALILLWPVAVVGGAYSYSQYERDALDVMTAFWTSVQTFSSVKPVDAREELIHTTRVSNEEAERAGANPEAWSEVRPAGAEEPLTTERKLSLLEDRLARGEISEETYREIRDRLG